MTKYRFANTEERHLVDLRKYKTLITDTVQKVHPGAKVKVEADGYLLPHTVSRGEIIKIGRMLAKSELGKYCLNRPVLFIGSHIEDTSCNNKLIKTAAKTIKENK